eukprot:754902-Hanusia_phi.AAC.3
MQGDFSFFRSDENATARQVLHRAGVDAVIFFPALRRFITTELIGVFDQSYQLRKSANFEHETFAAFPDSIYSTNDPYPFDRIFHQTHTPVLECIFNPLEPLCEPLGKVLALSL